MARESDGSSQYITLGSALVTAVPLTMSCWANRDTTDTADVLVAIQEATDAHWCAWYLTGNATATFGAVSASNNTFNGSTTTATMTAGTWHHCCGVFASATSRTAYLDAVAATENTVSNTPLHTPNRTRIAAAGLTTPSSHLDGKIAEIGVWNVALTADEISVLADGFSPLFVRPASLIAYLPLVREIVDWKRNTGWTNTSTTVADHPRVFNPAAPLAFDGYVAAAAGQAPRSMHQYRLRRVA